MYYVYEWYRMDLNLPYYIGKGQGNRAYELERSNNHTNNVTQYLVSNGIRRDVRIIAKFTTEAAAFDCERERISFWSYLKDHGILTNQTTGGEGAAGRIVTVEFRKRQGDYVRGDNNPMKRPDVREKNRESQIIAQKKPEVIQKKRDALAALGDNHPSKRPEVQKKISIALQGREPPNKGKKASEETRKKVSNGVKSFRAKEPEDAKILRGKRIWETRRANGTDKTGSTVNRKEILICGHRFKSQKEFAEYIGMSPAYVTKYLKSGKVDVLERKYLSRSPRNDNAI